ncbi:MULTISPECIES: glycosyltransferase family 2 protein [unclassified Microbacterium]|uniref:glycosyltransferase family 2 protein n=1 Tax=unclassified Microbacterium TaxID=2609290 RepID=UPI0018627457|nr:MULTISPECIES: glycosyltransferase family 2 protein [unclassified Microbacterium]MCT1364750.1 glycosyltransferase family 2 protein [Microbacterium sp. p3-SID131]MCT1376143.1 glycosyltransferase family 2 protein [Microbacterium sp. p3-SID337]CAD5137956.1 Glycosyltransferase, GT2 family [Microbacterium sp. Nx66]
MSIVHGRLAVVVVNYASARLLERNLVLVEREARAVDEEALVVVVDNWAGAAEREAAVAVAKAHGWTLITPETNSGFGGGVNIGVTRALADGATDVLVINPDAHIDRVSLGRLASVTSASRTTLASPVITDSEGRTWFAGIDLLLDDGTMRARRKRRADDARPYEPWLSGACLWITREVWALSGGFDDEYFLYWEDVDFSRRVVSAGGTLVLVEEATAVHDEGGTQRAEPQLARAKSEGYYFYNIRNRMLYAVRHLDDEAVHRWRRSIPRTAREVILRGGRRQLLHSAAPLRAYVRGVREARRIARLSGTESKGTSWS